MSIHERALNVLSCKYVDEVIIGAPWTITKDMLNSLNISVVAHCPYAKTDGEPIKGSGVCVRLCM